MSEHDKDGVIADNKCFKFIAFQIKEIVRNPITELSEANIGYQILKITKMNFVHINCYCNSGAVIWHNESNYD